MICTKIRTTLLCLLAGIFLLVIHTATTCAQNLAGAGTQPARSQPAGGPSPPVPVSDSRMTLADLSWLAGSWQGAWGPRLAEQIWAAPKAGVMLGTFQLVENNKTLVLELITLVDQPDGMKYGLRHFTPSLVAWENSGPIILNLVSNDPQNIVFQNPTDGEPKSASIARIDADTYVSRSEIVPATGDAQVTEITYHRQKETVPKKK
jgi:hypothetical protein